MDSASAMIVTTGSFVSAAASIWRSRSFYHLVDETAVVEFFHQPGALEFRWFCQQGFGFAAQKI